MVLSTADSAFSARGMHSWIRFLTVAVLTARVSYLRPVNGVAIGFVVLAGGFGCNNESVTGTESASSSGDGTSGDDAVTVPPESERDTAKYGSIEVVAKLVDIPGLEKFDNDFPTSDIGYDFAYVVKYEIGEVLRGELDGDEIYVAHYNPYLPRAKVADARVKEIGGNLRKIELGDTHLLAIEPNVDDWYMGGILNYFKDLPPEETIYWAVWSDSAK